MSFFTVGNLLTLGIMALAFILYHQISRRNRALDKLREYGKRLKDELAAFVADKEAAVKDYAVSLEVQRKAAKELLKRLSLTTDEMTARAEAVARLDERLKAYDVSIGELDKMAGRVTENLNRLREEAPFVENAAKRAAQADGKLLELERGLREIEDRFRKENALSLEKAAQDMFGPMRSAVTDLEAKTETLGHKAAEYQAAVDAAERYRDSLLARDLETVNRALKSAVEQAGSRADKMEEIALTKLRDQAVERAQRFQISVDEKLKSYQESAKSKVAEIQGLLRAVKDEWRGENAEMEQKQRDYKDEWKQEVMELNAVARNLRDEWKHAAEAENRERQAYLERSGELRAAEEKAIREAEERSTAMAASLEEQFLAAAEKAQRNALEEADRRLEDYQSFQVEQFRRLESLADDTAQLEGELKRSFTSQIETMKADIAGIEQDLDGLKEQAYGNVSEKLRVFEDAFINDLNTKKEWFDQRLEEWTGGLDKKLADTAAQTTDAVLSDLEQVKTGSAQKLGAVRASIEKVSKEAEAYRTELFSKTEEQTKSLETAVKEADRHLKEFIAQTQLFDRADALKKELERRMEDLQTDIDRMNKHRTEMADLEAQFLKIKRMEEEVNGKLTRFLSDKRRIDLMENDFNRLIQTSQAVEEKLGQVSASDDALQTMLVQIRQMSDALADTEDRYQKIEKKNQTLETTNMGIERNFRALEDAEANLKRFTGELDRLSQEQDSIRVSVDKLLSESETAKNAAEKLNQLSDELPSIEKRIQNLQTAREWLARTETRLTELDKDIQDRLKLVGSILKDEGGKAQTKGAPPLGQRESVVKLARQGWKTDEIARALKLSIAAVELILEMGPKD